MSVTDWITVAISPESNEIVKQIQSIEHSPYFKATSIEVLLAAAAYSLHNNLTPTEEYGRGSDITNKNLITDDQKWFMCMLSYTIDKDKELSKLEDRTSIVKTFEQYAQAGLQTLAEMCIDRNSQDRFIRELDSVI